MTWMLSVIIAVLKANPFTRRPYTKKAIKFGKDIWLGVEHKKRNGKENKDDCLYRGFGGSRYSLH